MLLTTGEILTALNLLNRWRAGAAGAELARLQAETVEFLELPDLTLDIHVAAAVDG